MKKALSLILALVICLSLCACGGNADEAQPQTTTAVATQATTPVVENQWDVTPLLDDFGDPTGIYYACCTVDGTFSNTATTDSPLTVVVYEYVKTQKEGYDPAYMFKLLEYSDQLATHSSGDKKVLKIKVDGKTHQVTLHAESPNGYLTILTSDYEFTNILGPALSKGQDVPCILEIGNSTYKFTIVAVGRDEAREECRSKNNS